MTSARIVSFLPSATEMACALGLGNQLVGITHECDYPPEVQGKPIVVRNVLPIETMSQPEIDAAVTQRMRDEIGRASCRERGWRWEGGQAANQRSRMNGIRVIY